MHLSCCSNNLMPDECNLWIKSSGEDAGFSIIYSLFSFWHFCSYYTAKCEWPALNAGLRHRLAWWHESLQNTDCVSHSCDPANRDKYVVGCIGTNLSFILNVTVKMTVVTGPKCQICAYSHHTFSSKQQTYFCPSHSCSSVPGQTNFPTQGE